MQSLLQKISAIFSCISPYYFKRHDVLWYMNALKPQFFKQFESPRMDFINNFTNFHTDKEQAQYLIFVEGIWMYADDRLIRALSYFSLNGRDKIKYEIRRVSMNLNCQKEIYILFLIEEIDFSFVKNLKGFEQMLRNIACYEKDRLFDSSLRSDNIMLHFSRTNYAAKTFMYREIEMHFLNLDYQTQYLPSYDCLKQWKQINKDLDMFDIEARKINQITLKIFTPYNKFYFEDKQQMDHRGYFQEISSSDINNGIDDQEIYNEMLEQPRNHQEF